MNTKKSLSKDRKGQNNFNNEINIFTEIKIANSKITNNK